MVVYGGGVVDRTALPLETDKNNSNILEDGNINAPIGFSRYWKTVILIIFMTGLANGFYHIFLVEQSEIEILLSLALGIFGLFGITIQNVSYLVWSLIILPICQNSCRV